MSAQTLVPPSAPTLDVTGTPRIPMARLVRVEVRKMYDTRAGQWLLIAIGAISVLVTAGFFIWGKSSDRTFLSLMSFGGIPLAMLLPVLGILLVTQEWGQRTALVTFTHVPHRRRVLGAKVAAALGFALAALIAIAVVAAVLVPFGGASHPFQDVSVGLMLRVLLGVEIGVMWGLAFGSALLNSAFAIVAYYLVPTVLSIVGGIWASVGDKLVWIDLNQATSHLYEKQMTGDDWGQLIVGFLVWIGIPAVVGTWRVLRSEVK
ncbi:hypothetical protein [Nocardioides terrisoli]|uniref:hypothetical protein n=1 Tax=Nocardioides terrisoli TaxID=3388267 RepID=UPI00287B729F|nr:hypothetical protein [Nocardioides marmorisolisilvae]